jgi:CRP-like cAMP-binding protein
MPANPVSHTTPNRILSRLSRQDFGLLEPYLEAIELPVRTQLENRNKRIDHVYFIESGFASVVAHGTGDKSIEVGVIGWEGMSGLAIVMATDRTPHETYMQGGGKGLRVPSSNLRKGMEESSTLRNAFLNYGHAFFIQTSHTAIANGRSKLGDRLARWLLMAHDRTDGDELSMTHELLALMLGVRRPGVTVALNLLEKNGLIQRNRGVISIVDRVGLEESANGAYGVPEAEFHRLFG